MCGACAFKRNFLVEVFAEVKVNLELFKGKNAGKIYRITGTFVSPYLYFQNMPEVLCAPMMHFHVVYEQVGSLKRPHKTVIASSEQEALATFVPSLPRGWRGGISVFDDLGGHEDDDASLTRFCMTQEAK